MMLVLAACGGAGGITTTQGSGVIQTEARSISGVTKVVLTTSGTLTLRQGQQESLSVTSDDNLLPLITSSVTDGELTLGTAPNTNITPTRLEYQLVVTDLDALRSTGSATIAAGELNGDVFSLEIAGSGDVAIESLTVPSPTFTLTGSGDLIVRQLSAQNLTSVQNGSGEVVLIGRVANQAITVSGNGGFNGEALQGQTANIQNSGSGTIIVNAGTSLNINLSGSGDVEYIGNPQVNNNVTGSGEVRARG
jgi:hypothetical protein